MLSFEIIQAIEELRRTVRPDSYLFSVLLELQSHHKEIVERLGKILLQGAPQEAWAQVQNSLQEIREITAFVSTIRHGALFIELARIDEAIRAFQGVSGVDDALPGISPVISEFSSAYERFLSGYTFDSGLEFVISSQQLRYVLLAAIATVDTISQNLEGDERALGENEGELFIVLHPEMEVSKVSMKLQALGEIYFELCQLLSISYSEYPLRIVKVESGSLLLRVFGHSRAVTFLLSLIERGISYFHRNYTREGKIEAIPKRIEVINEVLGLRSRLAAEGMDTAQMEEEIVKCGIKISEQVNQLLGDQGVITVNGETYSVGEEVEKRYIEESRHLLLDAPRDDESSSE